MYNENGDKIETITEYSRALDKSITDCMGNYTKYSNKRSYRSLKKSLSNVRKLLSNIEDAIELLDQLDTLSQIESNSPEAKHIKDMITQTRSKLEAYLQKQINKFEKERDLCFKRFNKFERSLTSEERKEVYDGIYSSANQQRLKMLNLLYIQNKVPYVTIKGSMKQDIIDEKRRGHKETKDKIDKIIEADMPIFDELKEALDELNITLIYGEDSGLAKAAKKEMIEIKRVVTPKVISASKEIFEKLKHSKLLTSDLEELHSDLKEINSYSKYKYQKNKELKSISERIRKISEIVGITLNEESKKRDSLSAESREIKNEVEAATTTVNAYTSALDDRKRENEEYINSRKPLSEDEIHEIEYLKKSAAEKRERAKLLIDGIHSTYDSQREGRKLLKEARECEEQIKNIHSRHVPKEMNHNPSTVPPEYKNVKNRLNKLSFLRRKFVLFAWDSNDIDENKENEVKTR